MGPVDRARLWKRAESKSLLSNKTRLNSSTSQPGKQCLKRLLALL